jgi:hypothetical protein
MGGGRQGKARQGKARQGKARQGKARQGKGGDAGVEGSGVPKIWWFVLDELLA